MPSGTGDGILLTRISDLERLVEGLLINWEKNK
jgi:hypothetical protein